VDNYTARRGLVHRSPWWRRRHQHRARRSHYQRRLKLQQLRLEY